MTKRNLILRAALLASFAVASSAYAVPSTTIDLTATTGNIAKIYANELIANGSALAAIGFGSTNEGILTITSPFGVSLVASQVAYFRVDFGNAKVNTALSTGTVTVGQSLIASPYTVTQLATTLVSGGAVGDSYAIYSVTAPSATTEIKSTSIVTFTPPASALKVTSISSPVTMTYSLYETLTLASNSGASISSKTANLATFAAGFKYSIVANNTVASVNGSFKKFVASSATTTPVLANLGTLNYGVTTGVVSPIAAGTQVALADLTATGTKLTISGDFTAVDTTKNGGVFLAADSSCTVAGPGVMVAGNASATIALGAIAGTNVCYAVTGTTAIPAQTITAALTVVPATGSTAASVAAQTLGTISHDGTTMVAPLAQVPTGWISRLVLNNSGTVARDYTVTALGETGNTITLTGAAASGTIQPGTTVIDLAALMTATGAPRSGLKVVVTAPQSEIDGLFQIVNGGNGSISNHVLSYK